MSNLFVYVGGVLNCFTCYLRLVCLSRHWSMQISEISSASCQVCAQASITNLHQSVSRTWQLAVLLHPLPPVTTYQSCSSPQPYRFYLASKIVQVQGEAEREVVRVTVECCLQERSWNPYYMHLLQRLLAASKAHRVTLQYCLWDQFKQADQADMRRLINLAHLTGQLIATFTLSSSILKVRALSTFIFPICRLLCESSCTRISVLLS